MFSNAVWVLAAYTAFSVPAVAGQIKTYSSLPDRSKVSACTSEKQQAQNDIIIYGNVTGYPSCNCDNTLNSFWTCAVDATFSK